MTATINVRIGPSQLHRLIQNGYKLVLARMVNDTYLAIWNASTPLTMMKYTYDDAYGIAAAKLNMNGAASQPDLITDVVPIDPGQTADLNPPSRTPIVTGTPDPNARYFYFKNDSTDIVRAVLFQELTINGDPAPKMTDGSGNVVAISPPVAPGATLPIDPRGNVDTGSADTGSSVDSFILFWSHDVKIQSNTPFVDNVPLLSDKHVVAFSLDPVNTGSINVEWTAAGNWKL